MRYGWIRLHYALLYAVVGAYLPYMPVYLNQQMKLSDGDIGWILGIYGLSVILMPPVTAHLADRHVSGRSLIGLGYAISAIALTALTLIDGFWAVLIISLIFSMSYTPVFSLLDGLTFDAFHHDQHHGRTPPPYHAVRLWGSIGFMIPAIILFALMRTFAFTERAALLASAVCAGIGALTSFMLPRQTPAVRTGALPSAQAWAAIIRKPVSAMIGSLFLGFMAISLFYAFYSRLLQQLGVAPEWVGLIVNLGVFVEIFFILGSGWILRRIGLRGILILGSISLIIRLGLLTWTPSVGVAIATQILHAPIVLWLYLMPPMYLNFKAQPGWRSSMQGLYSMLNYGFARLIGSVIGGYAAMTDLRLAFGIATTMGIAALIWMLGFRDAAACAQLQHRNDQPIESPVVDA